MTPALEDIAVKVHMDTNLAASLLDMETGLAEAGWPPDTLQEFMDHIVNLLTYAWWKAGYDARQEQRAKLIEKAGH